MEPVEGPEHPLSIRRVEPDAVVPDIVDGFPLTFHAAEFDAGLLRFRCKFPGISDQIIKSDFYQAVVGESRDSFLNLDVDVPFRSVLAQFREDRQDDKVKVDPAASYFLA